VRGGRVGRRVGLVVRSKRVGELVGFDVRGGRVGRRVGLSVCGRCVGESIGFNVRSIRVGGLVGSSALRGMHVGVEAYIGSLVG